jgi:hypothetical protein
MHRDLMQRRGIMMGTDAPKTAPWCASSAEVPLAEMFGYSTGCCAPPRRARPSSAWSSAATRWCVEYVCPPPAGAGGEAGGGAGGEAGGGGAGGEPAEENVPCATECGRLADCATDAAQGLCPCYEPAERDALYAGCYETCTGPDGAGVLAIAQGQATCDGLVNIIKTLNPSFKAGCIGSPAE